MLHTNSCPRDPEPPHAEQRGIQQKCGNAPCAWPATATELPIRAGSGGCTCWPLGHEDANRAFKLINRRYGRASAVVTSNTSVAEWAPLFGDEALAATILDRLLHEAEVLTINGPSWRLRGRLEEIAGSEVATLASEEPAALPAHLHLWVVIDLHLWMLIDSILTRRVVCTPPATYLQLIAA